MNINYSLIQKLTERKRKMMKRKSWKKELFTIYILDLCYDGILTMRRKKMRMKKMRMMS